MAGARITFRDLPNECWLLVLNHLTEIDVLSFEQTCKKWLHLARSPEVLQDRIWKSFHLRVKACGEVAQPAWQELFRHITQTSTSTCIRFRGVFTDGGVKADDAVFAIGRYWVDNLFMPKHWDS
ncbi:hypothetical protein WJX72_000043 [[Myrmecia] bisecta]|uniref:F-box domain-containing protein n=1 Tax=[Myrmecia] bisecta TaxID=41462 RepID=A0AAW1R454_9CHLO